MHYDHSMAMSDLLLAIVLAFAGCRIVRIVILDTITSGIRDALIRKYGVTSKIGILLSCPWCVSWWVSVATVTFSYAAGMTSSLWSALLLIPAVAYAIPALGRLVEREDE